MNRKRDWVWYLCWLDVFVKRIWRPFGQQRKTMTFRMAVEYAKNVADAMDDHIMYFVNDRYRMATQANFVPPKDDPIQKQLHELFDRVNRLENTNDTPIRTNYP